MTYGDVAVAMIGDHQGRRRLTPTFTIWRNRLRVNTFSEHKTGEKFHFTTTLLLYPLFCLIPTILSTSRPSKEAIAPSTTSSTSLISKKPTTFPCTGVKISSTRKYSPCPYTAFQPTLRRSFLITGISTLAGVYAFWVGGLVEYDSTLS